MSHSQNVKADQKSRMVTADTVIRYNSPSRRYANSPTRKTTITPSGSAAKLPTAEKEYRRQEQAGQRSNAVHYQQFIEMSGAQMKSIRELRRRELVREKSASKIFGTPER